jgi:PhnB protein
MEMNIYLYFNGNCEDAMNFYKEALGGNILNISRFGDAPMPSGEEHKNKIMHAVMEVAGTTLMFSDSSENRKVAFGDNFSVSINCHSDEEITGAFNAMSAGGNITMPLQDMFWGAKFGMCCDKFGVNWMFNWDKPKA